MQRPRLLLLTTAHSYRNEAFQAAAAQAGVEIVMAYDLPPAMRGEERPLKSGWLGVDLGDPPAAAAAHRRRTRPNQPLAAVLPVDDSGVVAGGRRGRGAGPAL